MPDVNPHFVIVNEELRHAIARGVHPTEACEQIASRDRLLYASAPDVLALRAQALETSKREILEQLNRVQYLRKRVLRFGRDQWYVGPDPEAVNWTALCHLLRESKRTEDEILMVHEDSNVVVGLLDNPIKDSFSTRGLVVGHVQSGKTGNIAAVIAKAADTKYKFFLVLSGMTDQLRNQTQRRLTRDILGGAPERWYSWTVPDSEDGSGEFQERAQGGFAFDHRNQLAVVKKNSFVLRRFLAKLRNTSAATLFNTPFLIIDDECDQASVNSARYDHEVTTTNDLIRKILKLLPKAAYVGYTATPFANVLIDTRADDDLYPRHFIHALRRPPKYFGPQELFGRHALEGEYADIPEGWDMIRTIPDKEVVDLRPSRGGRATFAFKVTPSLASAIRYFIMVIAARLLRGQDSEHSTMLVHTDVRNAIHEQTRQAIHPYLQLLCEKLDSGDHALLMEMEQQWSEEQERVLSEQFDHEPIPFERLRGCLNEAAQSVELHVENFQSQERLDYDGGTRRYLVIGGNVLARGLTLHGLSVSYFVRSSNQYDTLMQMGRWFGYREGFEDLARVWVESRVKDMFFELATVETEIRNDIARYGETELSPVDFAVRIRSIPGMLVTARAKMRHARQVTIGLSGEHLQTFRFRHHDRDWLVANWQAAERFVEGLGAPRFASGGHAVFEDIPFDRVLTFLTEYQPHGSHRALADKALLAKYVHENLDRTPSTRRWNVVIVQADGPESQLSLGPLGSVRTVVRSAEIDSGEEASIKALMTKTDLLIDLAQTVRESAPESWAQIKEAREVNGGGPLLLLYPIEAESTPQRAPRDPRRPTREALNADMDVMGIGLYFPGNPTGPRSYVAANLEPHDADDLNPDFQAEDVIPEGLFGGTPTTDANR